MNPAITREVIVESIEKAISHYHRSYQIALLKMHYQPSERGNRVEEARPPVATEVQKLMQQLSGEDTVRIFRDYEERYDSALTRFSMLMTNAELRKTESAHLLGELREDARKSLSVLTSILKELTMHIFPLTDGQLQDCIGSTRRIA